MRSKRDFFRYVIPSMLAFALSGVYAIADSFFVGNALGDNALAAINIAYPLTALQQAIGTGIGMGGAILYSISEGAGDHAKKYRYFGIAGILMLVFAVFVTIIFLLAGPYILVLFGAEGEVLSMSEKYIRFIAYGSLFQILGTGLVPFIRNMGGSVTSMLAMVAGFATNIALDWTFVWTIGLGMAGAALATVLGQAITWIVCVLFLIIKKQAPDFRTGKEALSMTGKILKVGISAFGLTFSPNLVLILVNKSAAAIASDFAVTCYAAASYVTCVVLLLLQGVSDGAQPLISKLYGENKEREAKKIRTYAYIFSTATAFVLCAVIWIFREKIPLIFGASEAVAREVSEIMPIFLVGLLFAGFSRITTAYFYATEQVRFAYLLIYGEPVILLLSLLILPQFVGIVGTWISVSLSQVLISGVSALLIFLMRKKSASKIIPAQKSDSSQSQ